MLKTNAQRLFKAAIELGFLDDSQLESIKQVGEDSKYAAIEIAIRQGFLDRKQMEILESFQSPMDVAPGYRIDGMIGSGGIGVVYMATQLGLNRPVAIKTINQAGVRNELAPRRFEREARIVGQLRHPNIVSAFDFGIHNDLPYLVMEFVDGKDGDKHLQDKRKVPESDVWQIVLQICHALSYAHQLGIIHRDIKPGNLIFTSPPSGSPLPPNVPFIKIADFGLARFQDNSVANNITIEASVSGTPFYMSPEQIAATDLDHRSDIYSLGITAWHLITGYPPITGKGPLEVITNKMKLEDEWLMQIPQEMSEPGFELVKQMCRHNTADRIGDYTKLTAEVENVVEHFKDVVSNSETVKLAPEDDERFSVAADVTFIDDLGGFSESKKANSTKLIFNKWSLLSVTIATVAAITSLYMLLGRQSDPKESTAQVQSTDASSRVRLNEFTGPPIFLFNGTSVDPTQKFSGTWEVSSGGEGGNVLAGNGFRNFKCVDQEKRPLDCFSFSCGFLHNGVNRIEFRWLNSRNEPEFYILIAPERAILFKADSEIGSVKLEQFDDESFGYHQIQIESQPQYWTVFLNGRPLGVVEKTIELDNSTIQLNVEGPGNAHFEKIQLRRFKVGNSKPASKN